MEFVDWNKGERVDGYKVFVQAYSGFEFEVSDSWFVARGSFARETGILWASAE